MRPSAVITVVAFVFAFGPADNAAWAAPAVTSPCPGDHGDQTASGWALSTTTLDNAYTRHAYVGNGYLSQRVPATGMGYVETTQKTGWPLFTNAYDGAFVAGLYGTEPATASARRDDRRDPNLVHAERRQRAAARRSPPRTPAGRSRTTARRCSCAAASCAPR